MYVLAPGLTGDSVGARWGPVNSHTGEEAVGRTAVLAYVLHLTDTGKYAKPEVDPPFATPLHHYYHLITLTRFCLSHYLC